MSNILIKGYNREQLFSGAIITLIVGSVLFFSGLLFYYNNLSTGLILLAAPFILLFLVLIFIKPEAGLLSVFIANYFVMGVARYLPGPLGLTVDALLVLTATALFFSQFSKKVEWGKAWNGLTLSAFVWFLYVLLELFNPEAVSRMAWFYAMRGVALYMFLTIPLTFLIFDNRKYVDLFLYLWAGFTLIAVVKGVLQLHIGPDPWERYWLATVGGKTHQLAQGLRVFSFFTDAATYGGSMGYSGVVFSIVGLRSKSLRRKILFGIAALVAFYGMLISGTRGALAIPFAGFTLYALLSKRIKILITGGILLAVLYIFLKYSTTGDSIYEIRRFRTALDPDNPSLLVRKENQKILKTYLSSRPFGGGIGSAGNWGLRFSPGTVLAETPTDSWYVQIWAEQGRVGLILHLIILFTILFSSSRIVLFRLKTDELKGKAIALTAGMFGIMAASYGSSALGQMPNGIIIYMSMAFIHMMPEWERSQENKPDK